VVPDLPFEVPPDFLVGFLVFGVFLVVAGTAFAAKGGGTLWKTLAVGAGVAVAGWVFFGGRSEVATFFVVVLLVLKFLGGVTFVLGLFRSWWVLAAILAAIMLAATGTVDAGLLGTGLGILASFLGALSLYRKAAEFSPGRRGSRWNRRTAVGWVVCLFAASMLPAAEGLASHGREFKLTGMAVGLGLVLLRGCETKGRFTTS